MFDQELLKICRKLKPHIGKKADALWLFYLTSETPKAKMEAESMIHMFKSKYLTRDVDESDIWLNPPAKEIASGEFLLGDVQYGGVTKHPIYLNEDNFIRHLGIFSITGGGKTNVAMNLALGLLEKNVPFMVLDWKRSYRDMFSLPIASVKRLKVLTVGRKTSSTFNWNPLRGPPDVHPKTWISVIAESLEKSHLSGPGVADIFIELFDDIFDRLGVYDGSHSIYPNFYDARESLEKKRFKGRRMLWQDSCSRILKTFTFGPAAGAFNSRHPLNFEDLLLESVIIEIDQELPKPLRVFFTEIILRWIHLYRLSQGESEQLRHVIILEEIHNIFPKTSIERQATNSLENVFREIRGYGEGLVAIDQHPSLVPLYVLANLNTQIYLGLQHQDDIFTAKKALFLEQGDEVFLDRLKIGEGIVKVKGRIRPCHVKFPYVPIKRGSIKDNDLISGGGYDPAKDMDSER